MYSRRFSAIVARAYRCLAEARRSHERGAYAISPEDLTRVIAKANADLEALHAEVTADSMVTR